MVVLAGWTSVFVVVVVLESVLLPMVSVLAGAAVTCVLEESGVALTSVDASVGAWVAAWVGASVGVLSAATSVLVAVALASVGVSVLVALSTIVAVSVGVAVSVLVAVLVASVGVSVLVALSTVAVASVALAVTVAVTLALFDCAESGADEESGAEGVMFTSWIESTCPPSVDGPAGELLGAMMTI